MTRVLARVSTSLALAVAILGTAPPAFAQAGKAVTIVDANVAGEAELAKLPHMTAAIAKALVGRRPFRGDACVAPTGFATCTAGSASP